MITEFTIQNQAQFGNEGYKVTYRIDAGPTQEMMLDNEQHAYLQTKIREGLGLEAK